MSGERQPSSLHLTGKLPAPIFENSILVEKLIYFKILNTASARPSPLSEGRRTVF